MTSPTTPGCAARTVGRTEPDPIEHPRREGSRGDVGPELVRVLGELDVDVDVGVEVTVDINIDVDPDRQADLDESRG